MAMEELINVMSDEELVALKDKFANNLSIATLIEGILATRAKDTEQAKAKTDFGRGITKLFAKLPHPDDIHNVYARWGEVEVVDSEPEEIEVNGEMVMRSPSHKEFQWIVSVNHATQVRQGATSTNEVKANKRAVTVFRHNPDGADQNVGNFSSCQKAVDYLGIPNTGKDDARRILDRDGYYTKPYDGTDYTS